MENGGAVHHKVLGAKHFVRHNPKTDRFNAQCFHHVEFWCSEANFAYRRFALGLGMQLVAKSDQSTGNSTYASYVLRSNDLLFVFTSPYSTACRSPDDSPPHPGYDQEEAFRFIKAHGFAVRAVGISVDDADVAYQASVAGKGKGLVPATPLGPAAAGGCACLSEVHLYGDVRLRFLSAHDGFRGPFLPGYEAVTDSPPRCFGLRRLDHAVGNVHRLEEALDYIMGYTGFHVFAEFVAEDVGTLDSGLNSAVLASNNELVILPINEPTFGTKRKSQIQTYLDQNEGPGLQHLALKTDDIFVTLRQMQAATELGGFEFLKSASGDYYRNLPIGDVLTAEQYRMCEEMGILVDRDDQGALLQIFTKPVGDRPTLFLEIIQRVGCERDAGGGRTVQAGGCGGFGKGNFHALFKSIEEHEKTLKI